MGFLQVRIPSPLESTSIAGGNDNAPSLASGQIDFAQQSVSFNSLVIEGILACAESMAEFWFQRKEASKSKSFLAPLPEIRIPQ
jgi:hypothetical protein